MREQRIQGADGGEGAESDLSTADGPGTVEPSTGRPGTLYDWFARSADEFGDCAALEVKGEQLTYAELRGLAERLAARLVAAGAGVPPRRVGLLAGRSMTAYAGYLAILRIGAAVVPLNPEHPASVVKVLCGGLLNAELIIVQSPPAPSEQPSVELIERVMDGIRQL